MTGWIKFERSMMEGPIWGSPLTLRLFLLLSCRAVQKDFIYVEDVKVHRGQYLRSYSWLVDDLQYVDNGNLRIPSKSTIKASVDRLKKYGYISTEETNRGTLFTLLGSEGDFSLPENGRTAEESQTDELDTNAVQKEECKKGREGKEESGRAGEGPSFKTDMQNKIEKVTETFVKLRNSGFYITPKEQCAIEKICEEEVDLDTLLSWMEAIESDYRKRNADDTIRSFTYYEKALRKKIKNSAEKPLSSSARRIKETDDLLAKLEMWKREGEKRLANGTKGVKPSFEPVWNR
jgi:hypothetical protein